MNERLIYNILLATVFTAAAVMFIALYLISAPYGRHLRRGWGPAIQARAAWVIMEFPAVLSIPLCFLIGDRRTDIICLVFLFMWELHYVQRTFIFPFLMYIKYSLLYLMTIGFKDRVESNLKGYF